jgi:tryptophan halogenase
MKKFIVLGSGTAGLIAAGMIKRYWGDKVQVSLYYDASRKNIAVGESTTPIVHLFLNAMGLTTADLIRDLNVTVKLGINFKDWIPGTEYFHGFQEVAFYGEPDNSTAIYSIPNDCYDGGLLYNEATTTLPQKQFEYIHALHIDTQDFSNYMFEKLSDEIDFIDDVAEKINVKDNKIESIDFKNTGNVSADFYIDCSGFSSLLIKNLEPKWVDILEYLPIDRAIPQQVPYDFEEVPSYTLAEATDNGWIWQIPIGNRYGTGYLYSSKFTTDEEAREKYNAWLLERFGVELKTDRIIHYKPGYYDQAWVGNCLSVGLSSGFVEPLESTGIHIIVKQLHDFIELNSNLTFLEHNRKRFNENNLKTYETIVDFICLHYNTNRTDSDFWRYMTENKKKWVKDFDEKCRNEFLDRFGLGDNPSNFFWPLDSFIQVANGLQMFDKESINQYLNSKHNKDQILDMVKENFSYNKLKKSEHLKISHKKVINYLRTNYHDA